MVRDSIFVDGAEPRRLVSPDDRFVCPDSPQATTQHEANATWLTPAESSAIGRRHRTRPLGRRPNDQCDRAHRPGRALQIGRQHKSSTYCVDGRLDAAFRSSPVCSRGAPGGPAPVRLGAHGLARIWRGHGNAKLREPLSGLLLWLRRYPAGGRPVWRVSLSNFRQRSRKPGSHSPVGTRAWPIVRAILRVSATAWPSLPRRSSKPWAARIRRAVARRGFSRPLSGIAGRLSTASATKGNRSALTGLGLSALRGSPWGS
jgi:hypothetical protein